MLQSPNVYLSLGAALSAVAALVHVGCIVFGAPWYRFLGAGEKMVRLVERGSRYPTRITLLIAAVLLVFSLYGCSGAGLIPRLPLLRPVLCLIAAVYLGRSVAFYPLARMIPSNGPAFWFWSSSICAVMGACYGFGTAEVWNAL